MKHDAPASAAVRVGVIGAGHMGRNHVRVYDSLKNVELAGVYDADRAAAIEMSNRYGCRRFESLEEARDSVEAVSICSPSVTHAEIGAYFLASGRHCLIEKPLATSEAECLAIIDAARQSGVVLLVGHIERFNPAVQQVSALFENGAQIHAIDARRLSAVGKRITDVDVVADLMVHDIDIVCSLVKRPIASINAVAVTTDKSRGGDYVTTQLCFDNGSIATLTASRITQNTIRQLSITTDEGLVEIDYIDQSVEVFHRDRVIQQTGRSAAFGEYALDIAMERVVVRRSEPLQLELAHFVDIIRNGGAPKVTGDQALEAMRVVWRIQDIVKERRQ